MHREYRPDQMRLGAAHPPDGHDHHDQLSRSAAGPDHDPAAERRALWAATIAVGVLLAADVVLGAMGSPWQRPFGVPLALLAALIGGGRVVYLALSALFAGSDRRRHRAGDRLRCRGVPG